jgi:hypothetical protein
LLLSGYGNTKWQYGKEEKWEKPRRHGGHGGEKKGGTTKDTKYTKKRRE